MTSLRSPRIRAGLLAAVLALSARVGSGLELVPHSLSRSKQFVVYAHEGALRNAVGSLGDDTKDAVLRALGRHDNWTIPIVVDLRPPDPGLPDARPPVRLQMSQTGAGLKIELDLLTGEAGRGTRIQDELVRTVLLALAYENSTQFPAGRPCTLPPAWLVEGLSAYLDNQENGVSASMFAALLPTLQTMSSMEFLGKDPAGMDSTSHAVYRACAYNLVCLLLRELPGGRAELATFVSDLPNAAQTAANRGETLGNYFPELAASPDALAKWWTLALAQLATADGFQMYSAEETERRLQALLTFPGPVESKKDGAPPKLCTLADFREFTPRKQNARILQGVRNGLVILGGQASPFYRAIITGYQAVVASLSRDRTKGVAERLRELDEMRHDALEQQDGIADYINWYEATQLSAQSSVFNDYFHAARQCDAAQKIHRPDPISAYLDSLDTEFQ